MIKNSRQYKITKSCKAKFSDALRALEDKDMHCETTPLLLLQKNALKNQILDLQREIDEYEDLVSGNIPIAELNSIDQLPITLIKARISLNLSQKKLGDMVGLAEQQIQRYESTEYESASISKIKEIANALNLKIEKHVETPSPNFSLRLFFKKMNSIGIDYDFIMKKLLPPTLAARFEDNDAAPDLLGLQASYYIGKVFGIKPEDVFKSESLVLKAGPLATVKYKIPTNASQKKLHAHTLYAHYASLLASHAAKIRPSKKIPDDPFIVRGEILSKYQKISFGTILRYIWGLGIIVLVLEPTSFHAACFIDKDRRIIVLTQKTDSNARWMFNLLHEFYHASQGTDQVVENVEDLRNNTTYEERIANQFADFVLLGKNPHELAEKCLEDSNWDMLQIKNSLQKISKQENVSADVLANYVAFRVTSEQKKNMWGISTTLQEPLSNARQTVREHLIENLDFSLFTESDLNLIRPILYEQEAVLNG